MQHATLVNITPAERWASVAAGTLLTVAGLRRRSKAGALVAAGGAALIVRGSTGHCPAYARLEADGHAGASAQSGITVDESVTINRPPDALYEIWHALEPLPAYIPSLKAVTKIDERRSHWVVKGPGGREVAWDAEITSDVPNQLIAWRSEPAAEVSSEGSVRFAAGRNHHETVMHVRFRYQPPVAKASAIAAWLVGKEPGQLVRDALRRFKSIMEAGEAPTVEGQPRGRQSVLNYD